jgi:predicted ester cyclase
MKRSFLAAAVFACIATACNNSGPSSTESTTDSSSAMAGDSKTDMAEKNKQTALAANEAVSNHDADGVFKDVTADFTDYGDESMAPVKGSDSSKKFFQMYLSAFPDIKGENFLAVSEGNHVMVAGDWSGTFKGEFMGIKPTGKSFKIKDVDIFTFNDEGKITEHRVVQSMQTVMAQVGAKMK